MTLPFLSMILALRIDSRVSGLASIWACKSDCGGGFCQNGFFPQKRLSFLGSQNA